MSETKKTFDEILAALFDQEPLPIHLLYELTDLSAENLRAFCRRWPEVEADRRRALARHLVDICEEDFSVHFEPIFVNCFADANALVRVAALDGVWDSENTKLIPAIINLLENDESVEARTAAAAALSHYILLIEWGQLPQRFLAQIVEALLAAYGTAESNVPLKRAALEALGAASHPQVAELISDAYGHEEREMQLSAVFAMGNSADERWLPTVMDEMDSPFMEMRAEAARAAGSIGKETAVSALTNLITDEERDVALTAVQALGQIGGGGARETLEGMIDDPDFEPLQEAAAEALEEVAWLTQIIDMVDDMDMPDDPSLN